MAAIACAGNFHTASPFCLLDEGPPDEPKWDDLPKVANVTNTQSFITHNSGR